MKLHFRQRNKVIWSTGDHKITTFNDDLTGHSLVKLKWLTSFFSCVEGPRLVDLFIEQSQMRSQLIFLDRNKNKWKEIKNKIVSLLFLGLVS